MKEKEKKAKQKEMDWHTTAFVSFCKYKIVYTQHIPLSRKHTHYVTQRLCHYHSNLEHFFNSIPGSVGELTESLRHCLCF